MNSKPSTQKKKKDFSIFSHKLPQKTQLICELYTSQSGFTDSLSLCVSLSHSSLKGYDFKYCPRGLSNTAKKITPKKKKKKRKINIIINKSSFSLSVKGIKPEIYSYETNGYSNYTPRIFSPYRYITFARSLSLSSAPSFQFSLIFLRILFPFFFFFSLQPNTHTHSLFFFFFLEMKFGKSLSNQIEETLPEWRDKFLSYKELKKKLKLIEPKSGVERPSKRARLDSGDAAEIGAGDGMSKEEIDFETLLEDELEKFNSFFVEKEEEYIIRLKVLKLFPFFFFFI